MNDGGRSRTGPATGTALGDSTTVPGRTDVHRDTWTRAVRLWWTDPAAMPDAPAPPGGLAHRAVLFLLASYADHATGRNARPSVRTLAGALAASTRHVRRALREAVDLGLIVVTAGSNNYRATTYALAVPPWLLVGDTTDRYDDRGPTLVGDIRKVGRGHSVPSYRTPGIPDQGPETRGETPAPAVDPTHGGTHPPGNPDDKPCRRCGVERKAAEQRQDPTPTPPRIDPAALEAQFRAVCESCGALPGHPHTAGCEAA